jgi:two-component system chemotaxis response regulator CheY
MPDQDGLSVLREIRKQDPKAIVIMVTGVGSAANVTESLQLGAAGFVIKPYSARRIIDSLEKFSALSGQPSLLVSSV